MPWAWQVGMTFTPAERFSSCTEPHSWGHCSLCPWLSSSANLTSDFRAERKQDLGKGGGGGGALEGGWISCPACRSRRACYSLTFVRHHQPSAFLPSRENKCSAALHLKPLWRRQSQSEAGGLLQCLQRQPVGSFCNQGKIQESGTCLPSNLVPNADSANI